MRCVFCCSTSACFTLWIHQVSASDMAYDKTDFLDHLLSISSGGNAEASSGQPHEGILRGEQDYQGSSLWRWLSDRYWKRNALTVAL